MRDLHQMEAKADKYRTENKQIAKELTEIKVNVQQNDVLQKARDRLQGDLTKLKSDYSALVVARDEEKSAHSGEATVLLREKAALEDVIRQLEIKLGEIERTNIEREKLFEEEIEKSAALEKMLRAKEEEL